jgi:WD40 repeat protein
MRMWILMLVAAAIANLGCDRQSAPQQAPTPQPRVASTAYSQIRWQFNGHQGAVHTIAFSPDGRILASGGDDPLVHLWNVSSGESLAEFDGHKDVQTVAFSPDGKLLAVLDSHGAGGIVKLWDVSTKTIHAKLPAQDVRAIAFHPHEPLLAVSTVASAANVELWDICAMQTPVATLNGIVGTSDNIRHLSFSPDGEHLAARYDGTKLAVWSNSTKTLSLVVAASGVSPFAFSADSSTLALAEEFSTIRFYDVNGGKHQAGGDIQNRGWGRLTVRALQVLWVTMFASFVVDRLACLRSDFRLGGVFGRRCTDFF